MIDLSGEFQKFYRTCVVLPEKEQAKLRDKEKKNIKRLKSGLTAYNTEYGTEYKIRKTVRQGSMAMHTTVQNDQRDYDIDVAVVFDRDNLDDLGPLQARRMLADAIRLKSGKFLHPPECKTGCVRVYYEEGYHLDLPVFRRSDRGLSGEKLYEYARLNWSERDVHGVNEWFRDRISAQGDILRKIIRLSKMFCKSREDWNMPSGLIQTVLCNECLQVCEGLDETFLCTMKKIVDSLTDRDSIILPLDGGRELLERELDRQRVKNWRTRLKENLMKAEAAVSKPYSTHEDGMGA